MLKMCRKLWFFIALVEPFGKICFAATPTVQSAQFSTSILCEGTSVSAVATEQTVEHCMRHTNLKHRRTDVYLLSNFSSEAVKT